MNRQIMLPGIILAGFVYITWINPIPTDMLPISIIKIGSAIFGTCIGYIAAKIGA